MNSAKRLESRLKNMVAARGGMFVPPELTEKMIKGISKKKSVRVLFSFEMLPILDAKGFKDVTLIVEEQPKKYIRNLCTKYGYEVKTLEEIEDMNFDVTIGNPPFSENKGGTSSNTKQVPIYPEFFRLCSEKSKVVAMIMPVTDTSTSKQLRDHNELMNRHLQSRQRCDEHFEILVDTHWVLWDKSKDAKEFIKMDYDLPLPSRERLPRFTRGNNKYSVTKSDWAGTYQEPKTSAAITVLSRIRKDGPSYDYLEPAETNQKIKLLTGKWLLATVGTSNNGDTLGDAHIIKNDSNGVLAGANVYVWEFDKKKDAVKLQEWIHSEEFKSVCRKSGFIGSLAKTRDLPNYE